MAAHIIVHNPTESAKISKSEAGLLRRGASASRGLSDRGMDLEITLARIRLSIPPNLLTKPQGTVSLRRGHIA
ncbi:MAG: hypothetical protein JO096_07695 [Alphaproteobacteria bacterium]|nr:hypothetical protein [Alphaproteobacteria bacterium]